MKLLNFNFSKLVFISFIFLFLFSYCNPKNEDEREFTTLESFEIEILDSIMLDYIGMMAWSHISPDGENFLAIDQQKNDILLINKNGEIIHKMNKTGDQPDAIGPNISARPQFRNNKEIALLGSKGLFIFGFDGGLIKSIKPDFDPNSNFIIQNADQFQFIDENHALAVYGARNPEGAGFYTEASGTKLESIDLENSTFTGIFPYPESSRFNSTETFPITNSIPVFRANKEGIYLAFKNEAKIFQYDWANPQRSKNVINLKIEPFHLMKGMDPKSVDRETIKFDTRDFAYGSINNIFISSDRIILSYSQGLSDEEYSQITEGINDFQETFRVVGQKNKSELSVINSDGTPIPIEIPEFLGRLELVDREGNVWFSANKNEIERDYEVLFKCKIK